MTLAMTPLMTWPRWGPRGVVMVSAPAHIQSGVCHRGQVTTRLSSSSSDFTIASILLSTCSIMNFMTCFCQCVCVFFLCAAFLFLLGRVVVKLFWLILMVVLDSTLKYFVLSLFVCLRLGGHSQLPSVLVLSVFNSVRNFGENQKLRARKWIINKLSRRVCDYPGVLVNLSIGILVYFFLDKCKYNDAEGVLLAAQCPAGVTGGCWTQLKPNQDGAESRQ